MPLAVWVCPHFEAVTRIYTECLGGLQLEKNVWLAKARTNQTDLIRAAKGIRWDGIEK